jgi:hypothetical protein
MADVNIGNAPPIFPIIVGTARSGTTMLREMFNAHPLMAIPPESHFVIDLRPPLGRFDPDSFTSRLASHRSFPRWSLSIERVLDSFRAAPPASFADAIRRIFGLYAEAQDARRYGDKTLRYVFYMRRIERLLPEARFIQVIRDGRDVATAMLDADFAPDDIVTAAARWRVSVEAGLRTGAVLGPARYRQVRFEDVVSNPDSTLRELSEFVELPFDPTMLDYHKRHKGFPDERSARLMRGVALPPTPGLRDWRRDLSQEQVASFEYVAGDLLTTLGYELGASKPSRTARLAVQASRRVVQERLRLRERLRTHRAGLGRK